MTLYAVVLNFDSEIRKKSIGCPKSKQ